MASIATSGATRAQNALSLVRSILAAGLAIGVIGGIEFGIFYFENMGIGPVAFYQYVASALLGTASFAGGYETAALGVLIHFAISFVVAAVFLLAAARIRLLRRTVWMSALLYGAVVPVVSTFILPYTLLPKAPVTLPFLLNAFIGDAFFIGVPLIITVWWNTHTVTITPKAWMEGDARASMA